RVRDQLLQIARPDAPTLVESDIRKGRELVARQTENLEMRSSAIERDALLACGGDADGRRRKLARDLAELLCWNRDCTRCFDVGGHLRGDRDVEISAGEPNAFVGCFDQDV